MKSNYRRIGDYIRKVDNRNRDLKVTKLYGLSMKKEFRVSTSNTVGTNMKNYKIMQKYQFACDFMSPIRVDKLPVVLKLDDEPNLVSPAYPVFEVVDRNELDPEYLMMWFRRTEFDRFVSFKCDAAIRGGYGWEEFCDTTLPVPSIEKQRAIVKEYNTVVNRIQLNEELSQKLEATAQALYKHWFVDFEFPNEKGQPYQSSGGKMVWSEELEKEIPEGWEVDKLGQLIEYVKGFAFKSNIYQIEGYPIVRVSDLTNKSIDFRQCFCLNPKDSHLYEKVNLTHNDIIITSVGSWASNPDSVVGKVIKVPSLKEKAFLNQNMVRLRCKLKEAQLVFYNTLIRKEFSEYIISGAQGSANQASITLKHVFNYNICFPKEHLLKSLSNKFNLINNYSSFREAENDILFELEKHILSKMSKAKTQAQATTA
jgi:type I restriction enzyme S subunit